MRAPATGESSLVILPPANLALEIDQWRQSHDPHHALLPPHITVAYPPFVPEADWPRVRPSIAELLADFRPFSVTLKDLSVFEDGDYLVWVNSHSKGKIRRIRDALETRLPAYVPEFPYDYVPHVTIGVFDSQEELSQATAQITAEFETMSFRVTELAYSVVDGSGASVIRDRIAIGH